MNRLYPLLILMFAFAACKKEEAPRPQPVTPKPLPYFSKLTYWNDSYQQQMIKDTFQLDASGDLAFVGVWDEYYSLDKFTYDSKGNITEAAGEAGNDDRMYFRFTYDANNRVASRTQLGGNSNNTIEIIRYAYDGYNRIVKVEQVNGFTGGVQSTREYSYSDAGTLNPNKMILKNAGSEVVEYVYSYDNNPNPLTTLPKMVYYMLNNAELGSNNIVNTSITTQGKSTTNTYTYNADGLPYNRSNSEAGDYTYYYTAR